MFPVAASSTSDYINKVLSFPALDEVTEKELTRRYYYHNCLEAAKSLVMHHLRFVVTIASKYAWVHDKMDLIQAGNVGLMKAIKTFNPELNIRLAPHAVTWIKNEIFEFLVNNHRIMKVATTKDQRKIYFNLHKFNKKNNMLSKDEIDYIAETLSVSESDVREMECRLNLSHNQSLDNLMEDWENGDDTISPEKISALSTYDCPTKHIEYEEYEERMQSIFDMVDTLDDRAKDIITSRYLTDEKTSFKDLAAKYKVSIERISQLEKEAIRKLQKKAGVVNGTSN